MSLEKDKLFHLRQKAGVKRFKGLPKGKTTSRRDKGLHRSKPRSKAFKAFAWLYGGVVLIVGAALVYITMDDNVTDVGSPSEEFAAFDTAEMPTDAQSPGLSEGSDIQVDETDTAGEREDASQSHELEQNVTYETDTSGESKTASAFPAEQGAADNEETGHASVRIEGISTQEPFAEDQPKWQKYAAAEVITDRPKLVVVIDDLGLSGIATNRIAKMDGPLTLAFLPYAENLPGQTSRVKKAGHELMVHLPMEPKPGGFMDPGPNALRSSITGRELVERINWNLTRFEGFVGVNNHMGSSFTENSAGMMAVMNALRDRDMLFLDSVTTSRSVGVKTARTMGVPFASRDVFLDNERDYNKILIQLKKAERIAVKRGYAIAIGHPYPQTLDVLSDWIAKDATNPVSLAPLSQIVRMLDNRRQALAEVKESSDQAR
ncbi:hypothetical protein GCM10017044_24520 [Kordiimonas sediminis]|uniref:Divergent polysaccharide deacetylase family protein n=1 Tax=Kordiimonas sediminis TaxID=1735581 RepID=A0A919AXN5_9PROT|nr:divergent polysaccharide deacetylase family protein [Kordiimonas sediminis]GHF28403.1 hypothetical protein GCM10017044_24520 [Kordiimonas sediminis]